MSADRLSLMAISFEFLAVPLFKENSIDGRLFPSNLLATSIRRVKSGAIGNGTPDAIAFVFKDLEFNLQYFCERILVRAKSWMLA